MKSNIFIPKKINVGYQNRSGTYTGKLAYIIYYDEKGVLRKERSWNGWRDEDIPNDEFDNEPTEGFVLNKKAGDYSTGWDHRQAYCRVYDPRGFEFEITIENLLYILANANCYKGKGLEGEFVYGWSGKDLVLIRLKDMLEDVVDEKYYLSKEVQDRFKLTDETFTKNIISTTKPEFRTIGQRDLVYQKDSVMGALVATDYKQPKQILDNDIKTVAIPQATKKGYIECEIGGVADLSYPNSKTRRGRVQDGGNICPTLTATETGVCRIESAENKPKERFFRQALDTFDDSDTEYGDTIDAFNKRVNKSGYSPTLTTRPEGFKTAILPVTNNLRIRKLTPKECFRLMGFSDENFEAAYNVGISNSQLYKQAGNSIVVDVLYYIFVELYKAMPYLFDDLRLSSFFSGIGAFEAALDRLYKGINSGNFMNPQEE